MTEKSVIGRLAKRPYQDGDALPAVGSKCLASVENCDVESDQHRSYSWRTVVGYGGEGEYKFVCFQVERCWPTVHRLENCWFAEIRTPQIAPTPLASNLVSAARELLRLKDLKTDAEAIETSGSWSAVHRRDAMLAEYVAKRGEAWDALRRALQSPAETAAPRVNSGYRHEHEFTAEGLGAPAKCWCGVYARDAVKTGAES